jgi:uncharacterized protein YegJ (DUF2314 family)
MRLPLPLTVFVVLAFASQLGITQQRDENEIVFVRERDPEMVAAIRQARAGLDEFLKLAEKPPTDVSGLKLKVMVSDQNGTEHFWVSPFQSVGDKFEGTLANEPRVVRSVRNGQLIAFTRGEISDWGYVRNGRQVGSFTVCVLLRKVPKEQADFYRKNHGFDC